MRDLVCDGHRGTVSLDREDCTPFISSPAHRSGQQPAAAKRSTAEKEKMNHPLIIILAAIALPLFSLATQLHAGIQLNENSFDELTKSGLWFIENFSPFCPHCKRFAPTWIDLVEKMKPYEAQGLKMGQIDCIAQGDLCIKLKVDFYPQMKLFEDGKFVEHYSGDKTAAAIKSFLESKLEAYKLKHKPTDIFESEPAVLEPEAPGNTIDEELAAESPLATDHSSSAHHQIPNINEAAEQLSFESAPNKDGKLIHLNSYNWAELTHLHHSGHPMLIHYHTAWCKECRTLMPTLVEAAAHLKHQVNVGEFDCEAKWNKDICAKEGLVDFPAFVLYHDGTKLAYTDDKTLGGLVDFARRVSNTRGTHEIGLQELDNTIRTIPVFFLFLHSSNTPLSTINAVQSVGKSFAGTVLILKSDHEEVFTRLSLSREHAYMVVFKEYDPSPWASIVIRDSDGRDGTLSQKRTTKLALAIRHWIALNSVPILDELSNNNFFRVLNSGAKKLVVLACLSGMVTDEHGQIDYAKSNPKTIQLREDMKVWAHQWRKSQEARGVHDMMIDWVWINAEQWARWLYDTYGINLPSPKDDPKESSMIIVIDAYNHKYYDTQADGQEIQFKPASVFQTLLGVEMNKLKGKLSGTQWGRIKWRFHQFTYSIKFLFQSSWIIFWFFLFGLVYFSVKSFKPSVFDSKSPFFSHSSKKLAFHSSSNDLPVDSSVHCKPGLASVFGLSSNLPSFKAD